jgi:hypothetical protein
MADITFDRLISLVDSDGHDTECIERFQFACAVKNLTEKTMKGYAERILYLHRYAIEIGKDLVGLSTRDTQQYILLILKTVCPETVNGRIRVFKVFYKTICLQDVSWRHPVRLPKVWPRCVAIPAVIVTQSADEDFRSNHNCKGMPFS